MSLNYRLVRRPDMRKDAAEGSKLYYAQVRSLKKLKFEKFCNMVAVRSSAFVGDVKLVIDGILSVMEERLEEGDVIQLGRLGNFRMVAGSKGVENEADFNTSFFNKARIVFSPGTMLTQVKKNVTFVTLTRRISELSDEEERGGYDRKDVQIIRRKQQEYN